MRVDRKPAELDVVEITTDQASGLVAGARGVVVAVHEESCSIEIIGADGFTIGIFEVPAADLERADAGAYGMVAREE